MSRGDLVRGRRNSTVWAVNSMTVDLNPCQGTALHLPSGADLQEWARSQQAAQDELAEQGDALAFSSKLAADFFDAPRPLAIVAGPALPMAYHAWRSTGADGSSVWLRACVMCPAMDAIDDYPLVAARAMLWHAHMAQSLGLLVANVTLHIPLLHLPEFKTRDLSPVVRLWVQQGRLMYQPLTEVQSCAI